MRVLVSVSTTIPSACLVSVSRTKPSACLVSVSITKPGARAARDNKQSIRKKLNKKKALVLLCKIKKEM